MEKIEKIVIEKAKKPTELSVAEFAEKVAAATPSPSGASAAACCAALASALGAMEAKLTLGPDTESGDAAVREALTELEATRGYLLRQADEDPKALAPLLKYRESGEEKRSENYQAALRVACFVPSEVMYTAGRVIENLAILAEKGVKIAVADVGVGIELALAAIRCSRLTTLAYAAEITDEVFAMTLRRECELVIEQYGGIAEKALKLTEERLG